MNKVIGLGHFSNIIAEEMRSHPEYTIYKLQEETTSPDTLALGTFSDMKQYEENVNTEEANFFLRSITPQDTVLFIVEGGSAISGATLRLLEIIKDSTLKVLYVVPDLELASTEETTYHRICLGILQEFARSGLLKELHIVDKSKAEEMVGDVSVTEYERSVANLISYAVAMTNYFSHTKPILESKSSRPAWCNISAFGIATFENSILKDLYALEDIESIHFYYGIPEEELQRDNSLIKKIKTHVKNQKSSDKTVTFSVYSTTFDRVMILAQAYTSQIQKFEDT